MINKINSKGIKITEGMKKAVDTKLKVLDKFLDSSTNIKISVSNIKKDISVNVMFVYEGKLVKVERDGDDFYYIIDEIVDVLKDKLENKKTRKKFYRN